VFKWRARFAPPVLARAAAALSLLACAPSVVQQVLRPSARGLLFGMLNAALAAFLLGFQVHEKSILLPLLPTALLALDEPRLLRLFGPLAAFSMFPLLRFEQLHRAYAVCMAALLAVGGLPAQSKEEAATAASASRGLSRAAWVAWGVSAAAGAAALHAAYAVPAPATLPHLHAAGISAFSAAQFVAIAVYANVRQWQLPADPPRAKTA
jgi:alpha-1,3-glucosyltransferase